MFEFYGTQPPGYLKVIEVGGVCPHCKVGNKFIRTTEPNHHALRHNRVHEVVVDYACSLCRKSIPIKWGVISFEKNDVEVDSPKSVFPVREPFNFEHVPESIRIEIDEGLDCLAVSAYNGFAAVCRRCIQAISLELGANATSRVKSQIEEMIKITGLGDEWKNLAFQIMLSGHDGAHPNLPEMTAERASVILSLLQDLTYQLFTRPGKIKEAAALRQKAIEEKKAKEV